MQWHKINSYHILFYMHIFAYTHVCQDQLLLNSNHIHKMEVAIATIRIKELIIYYFLPGIAICSACSYVCLYACRYILDI